MSASGPDKGRFGEYGGRYVSETLIAALDELAAQGKGLVMISSEMPELLGMADRILVMAGGRITGELARDEFSQEAILTYASMARSDVRREDTVMEIAH